MYFVCVCEFMWFTKWNAKFQMLFHPVEFPEQYQKLLAFATETTTKLMSTETRKSQMNEISQALANYARMKEGKLFLFIKAKNIICHSLFVCPLKRTEGCSLHKLYGIYFSGFSAFVHMCLMLTRLWLIKNSVTQSFLTCRGRKRFAFVCKYIVHIVWKAAASSAREQSKLVSLTTRNQKKMNEKRFARTC